jgi:sodium/hydrogen exchanger-like protein 6/7
MSGGSSALPIDVMIIFVMLMLYVIMGTYMEFKETPFGHETGVALAAGLAISAIVHFLINKENNIELKFNGDIFFYVCLPPIIFASGFNMRRRRFFQNIGYVLLFGIFGTILTFFVFSGLTILAASGDFITAYKYGNPTAE